jgi:hypothetical protein
MVEIATRRVGDKTERAERTNLMAAPSIFGGTDLTGFYTASGYMTFIGQGAMLIWFLIASVSLLVVKPETRGITSALQRPY